jgi:type II secretory pathway pseudopilin PulG
MKRNLKINCASPRGMTLIELTLVILVIMGFMTASLFFAGNIREWRKGKVASVSLRSVYAAQRGFLADHPRRTLTSLVDATELIPYLPTRAEIFPVVEDLEGTNLTYNIQVTPPVLETSAGETYDPSGRPDDSLWDVGE